MRHRVFYQNESGWLTESVFIALCVFCIQALGVFFLISDALSSFETAKQNAGFFISFTVLALLIPLILYPEIFSRFSWNIHMDETKVWMKGDVIAARWFRIQYPVEVPFNTIVSIAVERSTKNSSGQSIVSWFYGPIWSKKRYLVLTTKTGKKKRLHISHFTEPTLAEIIDEIANRCDNCGGPYDGRRASQILFNL